MEIAVSCTAILAGTGSLGGRIDSRASLPLSHDNSATAHAARHDHRAGPRHVVLVRVGVVIAAPSASDRPEALRQISRDVTIVPGRGSDGSVSPHREHAVNAAPTFDTIGLDLHKRESQRCILTEGGELIERRITTSRARFAEVLGHRPAARILLEASTERECVAGHLESLGHTVIIADPGFAPMYATRSSRVKTDKRDARTLCEALRLGAYRPMHRVSDGQRHVRSELAVRGSTRPSRQRSRSRQTSASGTGRTRSGCRRAEARARRRRGCWRLAFPFTRFSVRQARVAHP
ncbi:MAG: IS110 family transposase [bacterium]